jgi:hypothetical protein
MWYLLASTVYLPMLIIFLSGGSDMSISSISEGTTGSSRMSLVQAVVSENVAEEKR